jgi:general secretion pathway protein G
MVIIGLLVGYVAPRYFSQLGKSEIKAARAQISAFEKTLNVYRLDNGHYPSADLGLTALVIQPPNEKNWAGPYLSKSIPPDPWGRPYLYRIPGEHQDYDLISYGKDGKPGGSAEDEDITNN